MKVRYKLLSALFVIFLICNFASAQPQGTRTNPTLSNEYTIFTGQHRYAPNMIRPVTNMPVAFGDNDTGFLETADDVFGIVVGGAVRQTIVGSSGFVGIGTSTPSTELEVSGTVTATTFAGDLTGDVTGNADTATALAANPADCSANQYADTIAANGDLTCTNFAKKYLSEYTDLDDAIDTIGATETTLVIDQDDTLDATQEFPATTHVEFVNGAVITLGAFNLTFNDNMLPVDFQVFNENSSGVVSGLSLVYAEMWGAAADGSTDDSTEIIAATRTGRLQLLEATYAMSSAITNAGEIYIVGMGTEKSILAIDTAGNDGITHDLDNGALTLRDLSITVTNAVGDGNYTGDMVHINPLHAYDDKHYEKQVDIDRVRLYTTLGAGAAYSAGTGVHIEADTTQDDGANWNTAYWGHIRNSHFEDFEIGVHLDAGYRVGTGATLNGWNITKNRFVTCATPVKVGDRANRNIFIGNQLQYGSNWATGWDVSGDKNIFSGNVMWDMPNSASGATDATGDTDGSTATITGMTDTSDFVVGRSVTVSAGFPSATAEYEIMSKTSTTMTLSVNSTSSESNVTVTEAKYALYSFRDHSNAALGEGTATGNTIIGEADGSNNMVRDEVDDGSNTWVGMNVSDGTFTFVSHPESSLHNVKVEGLYVTGNWILNNKAFTETATGTVTLDPEDAGGTFTNGTSASGAVTYNLPATPILGSTYRFIKTDSSQNLIASANGGTFVTYEGVATGNTLTNSAAETYAVIIVECIDASAGAEVYLVTYESGTWGLT